MKTEWGKKAKKATAASLAVLMAFGMFAIVPAFAAEKANYTVTGQDSISIETDEPEDGYRAFKAIKVSGNITATLNDVAQETESFSREVALKLTGSYTTEGSTNSTSIGEWEASSSETMSWDPSTGKTSPIITVSGNFIPKVKGEYKLKIIATSSDMEPVDVKEFSISVKDKFDDIIFAADPVSGAAVGQQITLSACAQGYDNNISYTFYSEINKTKVNIGQGTKNGAWSEVNWTPLKKGVYKLIVEATDADNGSIVTTTTMDYKVEDWYFNITDDVVFAIQEATITINDNTADAQVAEYSLATRMGGETYWTKQSSIDANATPRELKWTPNEVGKYELQVTKYINGRLSGEKVLTIEARDGWQYKSFAMEAATGVVGTPISVKEAVTENLDGFTNDFKSAQYKLVYQKDNWETWGIAQDMTALGGQDQPATLQDLKWYPKEAGEYTLYLDIKASPNSETYKTQTFKVTISDKWSYESVQAQVTGNKQAKISPIVQEAEAGALTGAEYKYVWKLGTAADGDWSSWGVAKHFTTDNNEETITLPANGTYTIYVDIMDISGDIQTKTVEVNV